MPNIGETFGIIPRKTVPIIWAIDTSGSMCGDRIKAVNDAMSEWMAELKRVNDLDPDYEIKVGVLKFSTGASWITSNGLESIETFQWTEFQAGGLTDLGAAIRELGSKLSRKEFLTDYVGYCRPLIIFITDGSPTDDWESAFEKAKANKWFDFTLKVAIAIGDDVDGDVLEKLVGNCEAFVRVNDKNLKKSTIDFLTLIWECSHRVAGNPPIYNNTEQHVTDEEIDAIWTDIWN